MHAVIRHYKGNSQLMDELEKRTADIEELIRDVPGFVSYTLARSDDGGFSVSVFEDAAGTAESTRRAADFVKENAPNVAGSPPEIVEGETIMQFSA
jgi:heme-degrading monooxygenase HmoA